MDLKEIKLIAWVKKYVSNTISSISVDTSDCMKKGVDYVTAGKKANTTLGKKATAEGDKTTASGDQSHAEGFWTTASGICSHAEGSNTKAIGAYSHAEGDRTTAGGGRSHAEGDGAMANGYGSHAEGVGATAAGYGSHAEGRFTIANCAYQHVFGTYNIEDEPVVFYPEENAKGTYIEIVGNGSFNDSSQTPDQSNARTLDWSGNEWLAGNLTAAGGTITIGSTTLTEAQLQALKALLS